MGKARKFFSRLMSVLSVVIFIFGLTIFLSVLNASSGKAPSVLGFSFLKVETGSMEPEYPIGTIIVSKKVDVKTLKVGDVISFYSTSEDISGRINTHRIVEVTSSMVGTPVFITKGDANSNPDPESVSSVMVIGKVVYNIGTVGGSVISVLTNPNVILIFIVIPLIFITFGEAVNLVTLIVNSREEKKAEKDGESSEEKN